MPPDPAPSRAPLPAPDLPTILRHLALANDIGRRAARHGHHPFGGVLVAPDGETVLMQQANISIVEHAESALVRRAAREFSAAYLWECTLYSNVEPCAMCATTAYWANIGRVVFGMTEARLLEITGDHAENPTMHVGSRYIFDHGQKPVLVIGPVPEAADDIIALHQAFWAR